MESPNENFQITRQNLESLSKEQLIKLVLSLVEKIQTLEEKIAVLRKDSSTSSKPPSSDIVKPPKKDLPQTSREIGGQKGHPGTTRQPFSEEKVDNIESYDIDICPKCNHPVLQQRVGKPIIQQVVEIPPKLITITEYRSYGHFCPNCQKIVYAPFPDHIIPHQLCGPKFQALMGYMKGSLHVSYTNLGNFVKDIFDFELTRSTICNIISCVNKALSKPYKELKEHLSSEPHLHIDETGWKDNGLSHWVWVFCTKLVSFFYISKSRASEVLEEVLGKIYNGTIISDFFSAYIKYASEFQQFCLAHLIRDIKFLTTLPDKATQLFGEKLLFHFKHIFQIWHCKHEIPKEEYQEQMESIQDDIRLLLEQNNNLASKALTMSKRLCKHWNSIFRFLFDSTISPTNNLAEQTIRALVIDRKITQGSRSQMGREWNARIWTAISTCRKQNRSIWTFLQEAVNSFYFNSTTPSLLPNSI